MDKFNSLNDKKSVVHANRNGLVSLVGMSMDGNCLSLGQGAGDKLTSLNSSNTFLGYMAGNATAEKAYCTFIGSEAGRYGNAEGNISIGYQAMPSNNTGYNLAIGYQAGYISGGGGSNLFVGHQAGYSSSIGEENAIFGNWTFGHATSSSWNTIIGNEAVPSMVTSSVMTLIGAANDCDPNGLIEGIALGTNNTISHNQAIIIGHYATSQAAGTLHLGSNTNPTYNMPLANTVGASGAASNTPAAPAKYLSLYVNDTLYKIALYNP